MVRARSRPTRDYTVIVPLMILNLVSFFISSRLQREPIYIAPADCRQLTQKLDSGSVCPLIPGRPLNLVTLNLPMNNPKKLYGAGKPDRGILVDSHESTHS